MIYKQNKDGRWIPCQPIPYYRDIRPFHVKLWHVLKTLWHFRSAEKLAKLDKEMDEWMVPVEPYTDKDGKWHRW